MWRRYKPLWVGTVGGILCMIFFLCVGNPSNWSETDRYYAYTAQSLGGNTTGTVDFASFPWMMPVFGFFIGFMVLLWKKARE
jgi:hypothetical protein